ncbi:MAG: hypothetical protein IJR85_10085 [Synergistaceae bacterium]|nr:hypothetical protein [Synergistaceae bacterium]
MTNLVIFLLGLAFMLVLMMKTKFGPFVCMLIASLVIGLCCDLGTMKTINTIVSGFAAAIVTVCVWLFCDLYLAKKLYSYFTRSLMQRRI